MGVKELWGLGFRVEGSEFRLYHNVRVTSLRNLRI